MGTVLAGQTRCDSVELRKYSLVAARCLLYICPPAGRGDGGVDGLLVRVHEALDRLKFKMHAGLPYWYVLVRWAECVGRRRATRGSRSTT